MFGYFNIRGSYDCALINFNFCYKDIRKRLSCIALGLIQPFHSISWKINMKLKLEVGSYYSILNLSERTTLWQGLRM